jgi:hypothetical protein
MAREIVPIYDQATEDEMKDNTGGTMPRRRQRERADERRLALVEKFQTEGLTPEEADKRALDEMRDNPKGDWRRG